MGVEAAVVAVVQAHAGHAHGAQQALDALAASPDGGVGAVPGGVLPRAGDDGAGARRGARQAVGLLQPGQGAVDPRPGGGRRGARGAHRDLT